MKKVISVVLAVIMLLTPVSVAAFASEIDDQIESNVNAIINELIPMDNAAIRKLIETFQKVLMYIAPTLEDEKAEVQGFSLVNSYDAEDSFKCTYSISTDMNFRSLKTNIITVYEYRTQNSDGTWTNWDNVKGSNGITAALTRFNFGYLRNAADGTIYNEYLILNTNIPANTVIYSTASDDNMASIGSLAAGTVYEVRAVLTINNSFATTSYTSGNYQFVKGVA